MSIDDTRAYTAGIETGMPAAREIAKLFSDYAEHLEAKMAALQLPLDYVRAKVELWQSRIDDWRVTCCALMQNT